MENGSTQPGPEGELETRLRKLEEEAARLREQLSSSPEAPTAEAAAAEPSEEVEEPSEEAVEEEELKPATAEQIREADRLIARARLERTRGNGSIATKLLEEAEKLAPTAISVLELIGDDHAERRHYKKALDVYAKAMKVDPKNITIERKHADMVFRTSAAGVALTTSTFEAQASARSAVILSVILPGLGQLVRGQFGKGIAFMAVWILCLIGIIAIPNGMSGLIQAISGRGSDFNMLILVALLVAFITWISSFVDANAGKRISTGREQKIRPAPPVEGGSLPFE